MGTNAVGGMIVAGPEGFQKNQYRKFNIKPRRAHPRRRLRHDEPGAAPPLHPPAEGGGGGRATTPRPDLILVDGGQGQLDAALEVMADLGVDDVAVVGVAKGPDRDAGLERFFIPGRAPFMLEPKDPVLYYLQRLRDEAHRFAIGTHRAKRTKTAFTNPLDEIDGVGPGRKRALLETFGSARGVSRARRWPTWRGWRGSTARWPSASTPSSARPEAPPGAQSR